jgi:hypothetical protein
MSVPNARVKVATLKRHVGRRFALCGTLLWLVAITIEQLRFYALWPFQKGIPLSSLDISTGSFIFFATTAWTTVIIGMMVRLSYNITIPQRRRKYAVETFVLCIAMFSQVWILYIFATRQMEG